MKVANENQSFERSGAAGADFLIGGNLLKPYNSGGHAAYQERILTQLLQYYPNADTSLSSSTWEIMEQFWSLDLSHVDDMMQNRYSVFAPEPRLPSNMLRSYLLSNKYKVTSITAWASDLKQNHLHAILSGFTVRDTPGVGTFYDFFDRLWFSDKNSWPPLMMPWLITSIVWSILLTLMARVAGLLFTRMILPSGMMAFMGRLTNDLHAEISNHK